MPSPPPRRLTTADLAILTGGAALVLGIVRMSRDTSDSWVPSVVERSAPYQLALATVPALIGLAASLVAARAIPPRPRRRVVFRQPGTLACLAILAHLLATILHLSWRSYLAQILNGPRIILHFNLYLYACRGAGAWVAVAWATLALARAGRPEPSWVDRAGRALGAVAILLWLGSA